MRPLFIALLALATAGPALAAPLVPASKPTWTRTLGKDAGTTALVQTGGVLVAATWNSQLAGIDAATGKVLWSEKKGRDIAGTHLTLVAAGGYVVTGLENHALVRGLEPRTGKEAWQQDFGGPVSSLVGCPGHRLVAATFRGRLPDGSRALVARALDPTSGAPLWQVQVAGPLAGAGAGKLFAEIPSGTGRLRQGVQAIDCVTGEAQTIARPDRRFSEFLAAGEGHVVTSHFEFGFKNQLLCVSPLNGGPQTCVPATDGKVPQFRVAGAIVKGGAVYFSTSHPMAHNLDPSPDGWVMRFDLATKAITATSEALLSGGLFADGGQQIVTGFGTTGIDDYGYLFDPTTLKVTAAVALPKAPRAAVANPTHAFVGAYDGTITAFELPAPGPAAIPEKVIAPQQIVEGDAPDLGWTVAGVMDVHPRKARTSGSKVDGNVNDLLFLDDDHFAVAGNDDRVAIYATKSPRRVWQSGNLGKDVQELARCRDRFAARTYGGGITVFAPAGRKWRVKANVKHGFGWAFGVAANCSVIADDFDGNFKIYAPDSNKVIAEFEAKGVFDRRWVRVVGNRMVVSRPEALEVLNVVDLREGPSAEWSVPTPTQKHGGRITQARLVRGETLLIEWCSAAKCTVELTDGKERRQTFEFDVKGHGWSPTVGSTIELSPDGKTMVFFRRGLDLLLVDVASDRRQPLGDIAEAQIDAVIHPAFSPDGAWLAIAAHPKTWQVTLLTRK